MKDRTLILGTSHVGAILKAWKTRETRPDFDFYAVPVHLLSTLTFLPDGRYGLPPDADLAPALKQALREAYGADAVDLARYDRVVLVGQPMGTMQVQEVLAGAGVIGLRAPPMPDQALLSEPAFRACVRHLAATHWPTKLADLQGKALAVVPIPMRAETAVERADDIGDHARACRDAPEGLRALTLMAFEELRAVYAEQGIALLTQAPETLGDHALTRADYAAGALGLVGRKIPPDHIHMNAAYGDIVIDRILAWQG